MSNPKLDKIIEKVKKLLALGNSPNSQEAQLAMEKAQALIEEYNISSGHLEDEDAKIREEEIEMLWDYDIYSNARRLEAAIALLYDAKYLVRRIGLSSLIGTKISIESFYATRAMLDLSLAEETKKIVENVGFITSNAKKMITNNLMLGVADTIIDKIWDRKEQKQRNEIYNENRLVLVNKIDAFITEKYGKLRIADFSNLQGNIPGIRELGRNITVQSERKISADRWLK